MTKAKNSMNAKQLFVQRNKYKFTSGIHTDPDLLFDSSKKPGYGKKSPDGKVILFNRASGILSPANTHGTLSSISDRDGVEVIDFVAKAFLEMRDSLEIKLQTNPNSRASAYREVAPKVGWKDYATLYREYLDMVYDRFISEHFSQPGMKNKIIDVSSFISEFSIFICRVCQQEPFLLSSYLESRFCPPHVSGLVIDISTEDCGNDDLKMRKYLMDINYSAFVKHCSRYGFMLDKNIPWRLYANVNSEHMRMKMQEEGISNIDDFFNTYYNRTEAADLLALIEAYAYLYTKLVADFPVYTKKTVCEKKVVSRPHQRQKVETFGRSDMFFGEETRGYPFWIRVYIYMKINEKRLDFSQEQMDSLVKNIVSMNSYLDIQKALVYTNKVLSEAEVIPASLMKTLRV